jgi:hypothetical protein
MGELRELRDHDIAVVHDWFFGSAAVLVQCSCLDRDDSLVLLETPRAE